ncbi:MAG: acyl-CoA dehydrogenase [candidate division Zixibacteria bacterium 4484_93]|nr:MAG: acyl-CoA dehydrogenase [candidate division Zixibacteria bacterium 4484_93]RKZ34849.1 MAG: acyl-CoA dehydrogenase [bacterium]
MNYYLTEEQKMIKQLARQIAEERIKPVREHYDRTGEFPWEIVEVLAKSDMFRVFIPEEYDGLGGGVFEMALVTEELSRVCGGIALAFAGTALGAYPIILFGSEEQKRHYLPDIAAGKRLAAFALTEPDAGSDAAAVKTKAIKEQEHYIINGTKQWITNGGEAEIYTVFALTRPERGTRGISALIVEKGTEGFDFGKKENKMGIRGSTTRELIFQNCRVPADNLLGKEGLGFVIAMRTFDISRPGVAAQAVGIAQGAYEEAAKYAKERKQFGKKIINFQAIQFILADMAIQIEAARALVYQAAKNADSGEKDIAKTSSIAKIFASDTAMRVTTDAVQIFGGYGYMKEYPVEKMMRDAKITQIYEGTNQILRTVIGSSIIRELSGKN